MGYTRKYVGNGQYRDTSDDNSRSYLYDEDGTCTEHAYHNSDGTTDAYEPPTGLGLLPFGGRGKHK